jgi:hypothetical protein
MKVPGENNSSSTYGVIKMFNFIKKKYIRLLGCELCSSTSQQIKFKYCEIIGRVQYYKTVFTVFHSIILRND